MEGLVKGDVVVLPFPFSDLSASKRRPAIVVAEGEFGDVILCQITSKAKKGAESIELKEKDFLAGKLKITSYIRPKKIFTADSDLILYRTGKVASDKKREVEDAICKIFRE